MDVKVESCDGCEQAHARIADDSRCHQINIMGVREGRLFGTVT